MRAYKNIEYRLGELDAVLEKKSLIFRVENVRESNVGLDSRRPNVHLITGRQELRVAEEAGVEIQVTSLLMWPTQCQVYREQQ